MASIYPNIGYIVVKIAQDDSSEIVIHETANNVNIQRCEVIACGMPEPTPSGLAATHEYRPGDIVYANLYGSHSRYLPELKNVHILRIRNVLFAL